MTGTSMTRIRSTLAGTAAALTLGACAAAAGPGTAPAPAPATSPAATVDSLMAAYARPGSPGAAVLVFRGDQQLFARGYGVADLESGAPITPRTVFHVASVSKQFTAFAVAMLAAQGRLSLDDDVRQHLPELPDFGQRITLRHLLNHTSGLRDQWSLWVLAGGLGDDVIRQDDLLRLIYRQRELNFPPGTAHAYSNTGYTLLAEVVERVTGEDFGRWMKANVFDPLEMSDTQVYDDHRRIVPGRAYSYRRAGNGFEKAVLSYANAGATSLFTTTEDLARWLRNFGHARVGGAQAAEAMRQRGVLARGDTIAYALGIVLGRHRGLDMLSHGGSDAGYRAAVRYYPALDAGVVVLGNVAAIDADDVAEAVAEVFFAAEMEPARQPAAASAQAAASPAAEPTVAVDAAVLDRYVGDWAIEGGPVARIHREGERLLMTVSQESRELRPLSDSAFHMRQDDVRLTFHREADGTVRRATAAQGTRRMAVTRALVPPAEELRAYTGRYYSPELETVYTVVVQEGRLLARHRRHGDVALTPREANQFRAAESWMGEVRFERGPDGAVTGMRVSSGSGRLRNLWFEKLD
jgi:CubicO group peptidase (beta-lactamase class C family)